MSEMQHNSCLHQHEWVRETQANYSKNFIPSPRTISYYCEHCRLIIGVFKHYDPGYSLEVAIRDPNNAYNPLPKRFTGSYEM